MSFGISVGDFLAVARLINDIASSLRTSSVSEFRELATELDNTQRALYEIEHLVASPGQESKINSIKIAALLCRHPLDVFATKLKKYETLGEVSLTKKEQLKKWKLKLEWGLTMEEEVQRIRTTLSAHMASLNVRLGTQGLISTSIAFQSNDIINEKLTNTQEVMIGLNKDSQTQSIIVQESKTLLQNIIHIVQSKALPQITVLLDIAYRVWTSNMQMLNILIRLQETIPSPDTQHTHFQSPCKFEDALGRPLPVPAEYDLEMLRAIISFRFRNTPGSEKVLANEYEIFDTSDTTRTLCEPSFWGLIPGMKITMAFIIGRYDIDPLEECPRPGCRSRKFNKVHAGGHTCSSCEVWFDVSKEKLPRPFRLGPTEKVFQRLRAERKWFKNVKICASGIPKLPPTADQQGMWVKMREAQASTPLMISKIEEETRQENLRKSMSLFDMANVSLRSREAAAAKAIRTICEDIDLSVEELKDLCFNDFEPGILGVDSLLLLTLIDHLKDLGIDPPELNYGTGYIEPSLFEAFIKDFVNEYWYCLEDFRPERVE